jgi:hypothetical protein
MNEIIKVLIANFLTLALLFGLSWGYHALLGRRALMRFFGLTKDRTLRIFIGHLGDPNSPDGPVGFEESSEARNLEYLFRPLLPGLADRPGPFRFLQLLDTDVKVLRGRPGDPGVNLEHSAVSLGSPMSNHASKLIESTLKSPVRLNLSRNPWAIEIPGSLPVNSTAQGAIVRLCRPDRCFFYVFGITEPATSAAASYLFHNWRSMRKRYRDGSSFYYLVERQNGGNGGVVAIADHALS